MQGGMWFGAGLQMLADDALRCGLLVRDIPARVDEKTLRWLLGRKGIDHEVLDEILAVRSGSL